MDLNYIESLQKSNFIAEPLGSSNCFTSNIHDAKQPQDYQKLNKKAGWNVLAAAQSSLEQTVDASDNAVSEQDRLSEEKRLLEARKDSKLQMNLESLRKQQIVLKMYADQIKYQSETKVYRRRTYLDPEYDADFPKPSQLDEADTNETSKLSKEDQIDDFEIKSQFVAGSEAEYKLLPVKMSIKADIHRLCQMYLNALTKLKLSLPSDNVENRQYIKSVAIIRTNATQIDPSYSNRSSVSSSQQLRNTQSSLSSSIVQDRSFSSTSSLDNSRSGNSGSFQSPQVFQARNGTVQFQNVTSVTENADILSQCQPKLIRLDLLDNKYAAKQLWQDFVLELQQNGTVMSYLMELVMKQGFNNEFTIDIDGYDLRHRTMLVNMGQFFFDSIHSEERLAFHENSYFLKFFVKFAKKEITKNKFERDHMGNIRIKDEALFQTIMCLFEGLTRKVPAFNFLRFVFAGPFNKLTLYQIEQDLERNAGKETSQNNLNQSQRPTAIKPQIKPEEGKKKETEEKKPGIFARLWGKIKGNDKDKPANKEIQKPAPGEMTFDTLQTIETQPTPQPQTQTARDSVNNRKSNIIGVKLYEAMEVVYGGVADPFPSLSSVKDEASSIKRFELIEQKILEFQVNNHKYLWAQFPDFKPTPNQRVKYTEAAVRDLCSGKDKRSKLNDTEATIGNNKQVKDLTYYITTLVQKNFEQMLNFSQKVPFNIRALLKILIIRSRGLDDFNAKIKLDCDEVHMLADILIAGWLNTGYRNPKCFGIQPSVENELALEYIFFQAARITFEHTMIMQEIPEERFVEGFDVIELNRFIRKMSSHVFVFWIRLINIDISEICNMPKPQLIESNIVRIDDLELLYLYSEQLYSEFKKNAIKIDPKLEQQTKEKFAPFVSLMDRFKNAEVISETYDCVETEKDKLLIPRNDFGTTLSRHFAQLLEIKTDSCEQPYEYTLLFLNQKSDKARLEDLKKWQDTNQEEIKILNKQFVTEKLAFQINNQAEIIQQQTEDQLQQRLIRINSLNVESNEVTRPNPIGPARALARQSEQIKEEQQFGSGKQSDLRLVRFHKLHTNQVPISEVETLLMNVFNSLRVILESSSLLLDCLKDHNSKEENKDLIAFLLAAEKVNRLQSKPSTHIQVGCQHIVRILKRLSLEGHFDIQNKILKHFLDLIEQKIKTSRKYLAQLTIAVDTLSLDVERLESNITNMKQFHSKFENNLKFMKLISRYNPEVCFLECFKFELNEEWRQYRGLLLNLSCSQHQTNLPMSSYMLFGVVSRRAAGVVNQQAPTAENETTVSEEDLEIRKVRDKRIARFREHYYAHTTFTVSLQNSQEGLRPKDEPIKLIENMIMYYTKKQKGYLKTLVRADNEKYKAVILLNLVKIPEKCKTEQDKFNYLRQYEPFDHMNMVKTYTMFLQHISVLSSNSSKDSYVDEINDNQFHIKQHYDFLHCDLPAKALRYSIHDYIMRRIHRTIFGTSRNSEMDTLVQQLILQKQNHPNWVLTSENSKQDARQQKEVEDFTNTPEWCDPYIYSASLKTLLRVADEETPHLKAIYIDDAVTQAIQAMMIATPYKKSDAYGENQRERVMKHLILELCKIYDKAATNPRLYSQLLYILLFNIPQNEILTYALIKKQNQNWLKDPDEIRDFSKISLEIQHKTMLGELRTRYKVAEWFEILQNLIRDYQEKTQSQAVSAQRVQQAQK